MSKLQIIRGTASLPPDLRAQFRRAFGREMTAEERKFYGLSSSRPKREKSSFGQRTDTRAA